MKRKKNRFWTFWLSFIPGCVEMYTGFMKKGLSLMVAFWGIIAIAVVLELGPVVFLALIVWFYSFFHARNMAHMNENEISELEDDYLYHLESFGGLGKQLTQNYRKWTAVFLILLGAMLLLRIVIDMLLIILPEPVRTMLGYLYSYVPQIMIGAVIIAIGVAMIKGKKQEFLEEEKDGE